MSSKFLKLALLTDDSFALFLAAKEKEQKSVRPKFNFESYDANRCKVDFRFEKADILRLKHALGIPDLMFTTQRRKFDGIEGLCLVLRRLAYPNRYCDLQMIFGREIEILSEIFNTALDFIYENFRHLLISVNQWWLQLPILRNYAAAVHSKGAPMTNCFGFVDGTIHRVCRPSRHQREAYSGHKRVHCLKYQSVVIPNGLIANLHGPEPGRRHDSYMLNRSDLMSQLGAVIGSERLCLYGDCGYPMKRYLVTPHQGSQLTADKIEFNKSMSKVRICVEWEFGDLYEQFAFLSYKKNQKLYLQPVAKYYYVSAILKNCKTCLYGSQTSAYFNVQPPTLESYLQNEANI